MTQAQRCQTELVKAAEEVSEPLDHHRLLLLGRIVECSPVQQRHTRKTPLRIHYIRCERKRSLPARLNRPSTGISELSQDELVLRRIGAGRECGIVDYEDMTGRHERGSRVPDRRADLGGEVGVNQGGFGGG